MTLASGDVLVYDGNNWVNSSYTSYSKVSLTQPAPGVANNGLLNLGDGGFQPSGTPAVPYFVGNSSGTYLAVNAVSGYAGDWVNMQVAGSPRFLVTNAGRVAAFYWDGYNNLNAYALQLTHRLTSGQTTSGFGVGIQFMGQDHSGGNPEIGTIQCIEAGALSTNLQTYLSFTVVYNNGGIEILRLDGSQGTTPGQVWCKGDFKHSGTNLGFFGVGPVARQTGGALNAGATYTGNEQSMLNKVYGAMQSYGLLT